MSVEFTLEGCSLSLSKWNELLERWVEAKQVELYEEAAFDGEGDGAAAYVFGAGCIRGVLLRAEGDAIHVRLGALSSRRDWQLAFSLIRAALRKGGGTFTRENGETYSRADLSKAKASEQGLEDFIASAGMMAAQRGKIDGASFPTGSFSVPLRPEYFRRFEPKKAKRLEKKLVKRVQELAEAYHASTMVLQGGTRLATWALIPTIVGEVDMIGVDYRDTTIRLTDLKEVLGARAEDLGGGLTFLPALDREEDRALLRKVAGRGVPIDEVVPLTSADDMFEGLDLEQAGEVADGARLVIDNMFAGKDPKAAQRKLVRGGMEEELAEVLVLVVARIMIGATQEGRDPAEVCEELAGEGLPTGVLVAAMEGVAAGFKAREAAQANPRTPKKHPKGTGKGKSGRAPRAKLKGKAPAKRKRRR